MAHLNFTTDGGFDTTKMAMLKAIVKRRSTNRLNEAEIEDIASTILTAAAITASKPGSSADVATIAFAYARHSHYYSRANEQALDLRMAMATAAVDDEDDSRVEEAAPGDLSEDSTVRTVLRSLPTDQRRVLWLCDAEGYTLAEASHLLGVPVPTLHRRRVAARTAFRLAWTA